MKKVTVLLAGFFIFCCMALNGCGSSKTKDLEEFIELIYTSNVNGRYDNFMNTDMADESKIAEASTLYYKDFEAFVSPDYLDTMKANRIPLSYDKYAAEQNAEVTVMKVSVTKESEGTYTYHADLQIVLDGVTTDTECSGSIRTTNLDGSEKITYFSCDPASDYPRQLQES